MYGGGGFDQFGGGGFVPTQQQDPAQGGGGGSGGRGRPNKEQTLRAVTIRQLVQAAANIPSDQQDLIVDGFDLSNVTVVGKVLSIAERGGSLDLRVSDGTGATDLQFFGDAVEDPQACAQKLAEWRPGTYVRAIGHVRTFNGSRSVQAFSIRPIHDFNEVTYHYLQAIFQHLHLLKGGGTGAGDGAAGAPQQQGGFAGGGYGGPAAGGWQQQQQPQLQPQQQQKQQGGFGGGGAGAAGPGGLNPCASAVLQIISGPAAGDQGVHVNDICARLGPSFSRPQVTAALQFLQNEAHAYTTCDENHWRAT